MTFELGGLARSGYTSAMKRFTTRYGQPVHRLTQSLEGVMGYIAWAIVCYLTLSNAPSQEDAGQARLFIIVALLLLFIVGFYYTTREQQYVRMDMRIRQLSFTLQFLAVIGIRFVADSGVVAILSVSLAAQLPFLMSRMASYLLVLVLVMIDLAFIWGETDAIIWTALGAAFHVFALLMSQRVIQEQEARDQITTLNRELLATQALLEESAKQTERIRIARDLHDGLGHHLTALILKLQYLTYTTEGETRTRIEETHQLSRLLLTDVRNTVHEMRGDSKIRLKEALEALISQIPRLSINLTMDDNVSVPDIEVAEALFRCIQEAVTNTLKHGNASQMNIAIERSSNDVLLSITDNGGCHLDWREGAGLRGMRERIEALKGKLDIATSSGFKLNITIPVAESL
jgi:signal transduction histidine kinase